jgi:hypothetical protein
MDIKLSNQFLIEPLVLVCIIQIYMFQVLLKCLDNFVLHHLFSSMPEIHGICLIEAVCFGEGSNFYLARKME